MNKMHIAFGIDDKFVMPCGVLMLSILKTNKDIKIHFYLLTEYISDKNKQLLAAVVQNYDCELHYYEIKNNELFKTLPVTRHLSIAMYYRLLIARLLPESVTKILYLDSDMLCVDSLSALWETDITDYAVAVSPSTGCDNITVVNRIGYSILDGHIYFNSGMMLINADYWRKNGIGEKCLMFIENYPERIIFPDQDALNYATLGCRIVVPFRYNCIDITEDVKYMMVRKEFHNDIEDGQENPAIIHFVGECKPWHKECDHPYKELWLFVKNQTPWKQYKLKPIFKGYKKIKWILFKLFGRSIFERIGLANKRYFNDINFLPIINSIYERFK